MPENANNSSTFTSSSFGKKHLSWVFPEYEKHDRGALWYLIMAIVTLGLLAYCVLDRNFLFAIMIILFDFILLVNHRRDPMEMTIAFYDRGIQIGKDFYLYREFENFSVIYEPPMVKRLYLVPKNTLTKREFSVPLMDQNPVEVRSFLLDFVPEDLDKETESGHDTMSRILKI